MPRKIFGYNGLTDFFAYQQRERLKQQQGTIELYFGRGFTEEEEEREVKSALHFYEIANSLGVPHVTRLKVIHDEDEDDGSRRPLYYVQLDNLDWE